MSKAKNTEPRRDFTLKVWGSNKGLCLDDEREEVVEEVTKSYGGSGALEDLRARVQTLEEWVREILISTPTPRLVRMLRNKGREVTENTPYRREGRS